MAVLALINSAVGASKNHLGLFNGVGSGRVLRVWRIEVVNHLTANNAGTATSFTASRTTTVGTGTAAAIRLEDLRDPPIPSQITGTHTYTVAPTVMANSEFGEVTVYTEETTGQTTKVPLFEADPVRGMRPLVLREGNGVVVQQSALVSAGAVSIFIYFTADKR
jgi:hypothetical protein